MDYQVSVTTASSESRMALEGGTSTGRREAVSASVIGKADEHLDWDKINQLRERKPVYSFLKLAQLGLVEAFPTFMLWLRGFSFDLEPHDLICTEGVLAVLRDESSLICSIENQRLKKFLLLPDQLERLILENKN